MRGGTKIAFADGLRGIAALCVVAAHYGLLFWAPDSPVAQIANVAPLPPGAVPRLAEWGIAGVPFFNIGSFGVTLFFMISGFLIPLSLERLDARAFIWARAWRIVPTYMTGFAFTIAALLVASAVYGRPFPYSAAAVAIHAIPGLRALLVSPHIDYVVWTLEVEVAFYALCAAMRPWLRSGSVMTFIPPTVILVAAMIRGNPYQPHAISIELMFAGVALSFAYAGKGCRASNAAGALAFGAAMLASFWIVGVSGAVSGGLAAAVFACCYVARARFPDLWPLRALSSISYPLYVVHGIMGYVAMRIMLDHGFSPRLTVLLALMLATAVSVVIHVLVEVPTQAIGKRHYRRAIFSPLPRSQPAVSAPPETAA